MKKRRGAGQIVGWLGNSPNLKVKATRQKGRATEAVVTLLADRLGLDPSSIAVVSSHGAPAKVMDVDGRDAAALRQAFSSDNRVKTVQSSGSIKQE